MNAVFNKGIKYFFGIVCLFLWACGGDKDKQKIELSFNEKSPKKGVLPIHTMRHIIWDMLVFQEYLKENPVCRNGLHKDSVFKTAYAILLEKYHTDMLTLRKSFDYYGSDVDTTVFLFQDSLILNK